MAVINNLVYRNQTFHCFNELRPKDCSFGEVVCIDLYIQGEYLGYSKRKSVHVPPSSNAWWNLVNLRTLATRHANSVGLSRDDRKAVSVLILRSVRRAHLLELVLTYGMSGALLEKCPGWLRQVLLDLRGSSGELPTTIQYYSLSLTRIESLTGHYMWKAKLDALCDDGSSAIAQLW